MHRIDHNTRSIDENGTGKDGFTEGAPGTIAATRITGAWHNDVQEEICSIVELTDTLVKGDQDQAATTLLKMFEYQALSNVTRLTQASAYTGNFNAIHAEDYTDAVAVGAGGEIQSLSLASFGDTWTHQAAAGSYSDLFYAVDYASFLSKWVIAGRLGEIETASSPSSWSKQTQATSYSGTFYGIAHSENAVVLVGSGGEIQRTLNGTTFSEERATGDHLRTVCYHDGLFVAAGDSGSTLTSVDDGDTWSTRTSAAHNWQASMYNPYTERFYIGGGTGSAAKIMSSSNGSTWTNETISSADDVKALVMHGRTPVAVCGNHIYIKGKSGTWQLFYKWCEGVPSLYYAASHLPTVGVTLFAGYGGGLFATRAFNRPA